MRKWFIAGVGLALAVLLAGVPVRAGDAVVSGLIATWYRVKGKVPEEAYFQVVKKEHQLKSGRDKSGLGDFLSDLPRIPARKSGGFRVNLGQLPPGEYFIALQRGYSGRPLWSKTAMS